MNSNTYDIIIIGPGVSGSAVARELSRKERRIAVLERESDICEGTSKANSGIVHAGYDAVPGTLKAKLNIEGNRMMGKLSKELDFSFKRTGSFVMTFEEGGALAVETREMVCINCPLGCMLTVTKENDGSVTVTGNTCPRGEEYGRTELTDPRRTVTTTVRVKEQTNRVVLVKTVAPIPKGKIRECIEVLKQIEVSSPVLIGDVILENVADTGVDIVATKEFV